MKRRCPIKICAIVPAKGQSRRLSQKNLRKVQGKPMFLWVLDALKNSEHVDRVICSSEDTEIQKITLEEGHELWSRHKRLAEEGAEVPDVVESMIGCLEEEWTHLLIAQPNFPEITKAAIDRFIELYLSLPVDELVSTDIRGVTNGALRLIKKVNMWKYPYSTCQGFVILEVDEVHDMEDLIKVRTKIAEREKELEKNND